MSLLRCSMEREAVLERELEVQDRTGFKVWRFSPAL